MCGFGVSTIFTVAIALIVILVVLALIRVAFPALGANIAASPYWNIIQIVIGGVVAIIVLLLIWRFAQCTGLLGKVGYAPQYADWSRALL